MEAEIGGNARGGNIVRYELQGSLAVARHWQSLLMALIASGGYQNVKSNVNQQDTLIHGRVRQHLADRWI